MSTCKLGNWFSRQGHDVAVFSFANEGHRPCGFGELVSTTLPDGHRNPFNLGLLRTTLEGFKPDIVINQMPYEHVIGELLEKNKSYLLLGCLRNTLFSVKGNLESYVVRRAPGPLRHLAGWAAVQQAFLALHRGRHRADLLKILDTYDHFVMFGPPNLEELAWFVPDFDPERVRLVPNSIPYVAPESPVKEKSLLWLGRVDDNQKRAKLILPIWKRVSASLKDWQLDVVGDGPELEDLEVEARNQGLERIHFHGRQVPDDYYRRASIFFMTSAFEGFPNTLIEAQSFGAIPVVFDSYPVASWIVQDGESGFLIAPFEVDAMAERIVTLAKDPDRSKFADGALESARRFHIDRVGEMWQQLFEEALAAFSEQRDSSVPGRS